MAQTTAAQTTAAQTTAAHSTAAQNTAGHTAVEQPEVAQPAVTHSCDAPDETTYRPVVARTLRGFTGVGYDKGRPLLVQAAWFAALHLFFVKWWFPARLRPLLLRAFGARIGQRVLIRRRRAGPLAVEARRRRRRAGSARTPGSSTSNRSRSARLCVSQGALLCTGSHLRRCATFEFDNGPIRLEAGGWVAARAVVLRGVTVGRGAVVGAGAVAHQDLAADSVLTARGTQATAFAVSAEGGTA